MIRNRFISCLKRYHPRSRRRRLHLEGNREVSGSGGSMIARLKLEGIDGGIPPLGERNGESSGALKRGVQCRA